MDSLDILAASRDEDLLQRAVALAALRGLPDAELILMGRRLALAVAPADDQGASITSVYEYALSVRNADEEYARAVLREKQAAVTAAQASLDDVLARSPIGQDLSAVTDAHLNRALDSLFPESE